MCDNNVGVAKRLDLTRVSKELADLVAELDGQANEEHVEIDAARFRGVERSLMKAIG